MVSYQNLQMVPASTRSTVRYVLPPRTDCSSVAWQHPAQSLHSDWLKGGGTLQHCSVAYQAIEVRLIRLTVGAFGADPWA